MPEYELRQFKALEFRFLPVFEECIPGIDDTASDEWVIEWYVLWWPDLRDADKARIEVFSEEGSIADGVECWL